MKRTLKIATLVFLGLVSTLAFGQEVGDLGTDNQRPQVVARDSDSDRTEVIRGAPRVVSVTETDGGVKLVDQSTHEEWIEVKPNPGATHRRIGRSGEFAWNYYAKKREFRWESLEGYRIEVDQNDIPFRKIDCGNVLLASRKVLSNSRSATRERTIIRNTQVETQVDYHHYHTDTKYVKQYEVVHVYPPQQQYIGQMGATTVVSPTMGGITSEIGGGTSINNCISVSSKNINTNTNKNKNKNKNDNRNDNKNDNRNNLNNSNRNENRIIITSPKKPQPRPLPQQKSLSLVGLVTNDPVRSRSLLSPRSRKPLLGYRAKPVLGENTFCFTSSKEGAKRNG